MGKNSPPATYDGSELPAIPWADVRRLREAKVADGDRNLSVAEAADLRHRLAVKIAELEDRKRLIDAQLIDALTVAKCDAVMCGTHLKLQVVRGTTSYLDKNKLVELGVEADLIQKATVTKDRSPYVQVRDLAAAKIRKNGEL